jgi:hypothetical protein
VSHFPLGIVFLMVVVVVVVVVVMVVAAETCRNVNQFLFYSH